jgi:DNA invertase Pin-like site-specific DNA recombinase
MTTRADRSAISQAVAKAIAYHDCGKPAASAPGVSTMRRRVALYLRVSTAEQTVENQRGELEAVAARHGWQIVASFADEGISGTKGRDKRPGLDRLCKGIARREFDLVAAWSVDRLGRSLQDLVSFLGELHAKGVDLYLHQQGLDTTTPAGKAMFQMLGVFAEFERAMIVERVRSGLARAREKGTKSGNAIGRPKLAPARERAIRDALAAGKGMTAIAKEMHVGAGTVLRIARAVAAEARALARARDQKACVAGRALAPSSMCVVGKSEA